MHLLTERYTKGVFPPKMVYNLYSTNHLTLEHIHVTFEGKAT